MIAIVYGTRPELIKIYPILLQLKKKLIPFRLIFSGQHNELVSEIIRELKIKNDYQLNIFKKNQHLNASISKILINLNNILREIKPSSLMIQGDTLTSYASAIVAFNLKIKILHIEAGLRTGNFDSPFPEEMYRVVISRLTHIHFCPTKKNSQNLRNEGINKNIYITGNTVVDSLGIIKKSLNSSYFKNYFEKLYKLNFSKRLILFTCHRRENYGQVFNEISDAIKKISEFNDINIVYPLHLNPKFYNQAKKNLGHLKGVFLIPNQNYNALLYLMSKSDLIITDSGGIQEEAPSFKKKVLVIRNHTERTEGLRKGIVELIGTKSKDIILKSELFLKNKNKILIKNPYGDGKSAKRIVNIIKEKLY